MINIALNAELLMIVIVSKILWKKFECLFIKDCDRKEIFFGAFLSLSFLARLRNWPEVLFGKAIILYTDYKRHMSDRGDPKFLQSDV